MGGNIDPEGIELKATLKYIDFSGKDVLEVGCGDGRLTLRYADLAKRVVAIDPEAGEIDKAKRSVPENLLSKLEFRVGGGEELPFPDGSYDVVFFTHSLCCISPSYIIRALEEAWRVLKPEGILVNLQPSLQQPFQGDGLFDSIDGDLAYLVTNKPEDLVGPMKGQRDSRKALKYVTLIQGMFDLIAEEEFTDNIYYDTVENALITLIKDRQEEYGKLDEAIKEEIQRRLSSLLTERGVMTRWNVVLTVLARRSMPRLHGT
jgi:ubiquinone/menaquinone biosynthesis C-methylase UbiE